MHHVFLSGHTFRVFAFNADGGCVSSSHFAEQIMLGQNFKRQFTKHLCDAVLMNSIECFTECIVTKMLWSKATCTQKLIERLTEKELPHEVQSPICKTQSVDNHGRHCRSRAHQTTCIGAAYQPIDPLADFQFLNNRTHQSVVVEHRRANFKIF